MRALIRWLKNMEHIVGEINLFRQKCLHILMEQTS
jgi:hypothetical protein